MTPNMSALSVSVQNAESPLDPRKEVDKYNGDRETANQRTLFKLTDIRQEPTVDALLKDYNIPDRYHDLAKQVFGWINEGSLVSASPGLVESSQFGGVQDIPHDTSAKHMYHHCVRVTKRDDVLKNKKGGAIANAGANNVGAVVTMNTHNELVVEERVTTNTHKVWARTSFEKLNQPLDGYAEIFITCLAAREGVGPRVYGASMYDDFLSMYLEYAPSDLFDVTTNAKNQTIWQKINTDLVERIKGLAKMNLCHRDLRPENVVVMESGEAMVIDYDPSFVAFVEAEERCLTYLNATFLLAVVFCTYIKAFAYARDGDGNVKLTAENNPIFRLRDEYKVDCRRLHDLYSGVYILFAQIEAEANDEFCTAIKGILDFHRQIDTAREGRTFVRHLVEWTKRGMDCTIVDMSKESYFDQVVKLIKNRWAALILTIHPLS